MCRSVVNRWWRPVPRMSLGSFPVLGFYFVYTSSQGVDDPTHPSDWVGPRVVVVVPRVSSLTRPPRPWEGITGTSCSNPCPERHKTGTPFTSPPPLSHTVINQWWILSPYCGWAPPGYRLRRFRLGVDRVGPQVSVPTRSPTVTLCSSLFRTCRILDPFRTRDLGLWRIFGTCYL